MLSFHALRSGLNATLLGWVDIIKNSGSLFAYAEYLARTICSAVAFRNDCTSLWTLEQHDEYVPPAPHGQDSMAAPPNPPKVMPPPPFLPPLFFFFLVAKRALSLELLHVDDILCCDGERWQVRGVAKLWTLGNSFSCWKITRRSHILHESIVPDIFALKPDRLIRWSLVSQESLSFPFTFWMLLLHFWVGYCLWCHR